jgi:uncharacterized protein YxjI
MLAVVRYLMSSKWALTEHFSITDQSGAPVFDVHGNFGLVKEVSFKDTSGREVAKLKKHVLSNRYEILVGGEHAAEIQHKGLFGEHYEIGTSQGVLDARGDFGGWNYTLSRGGVMCATVTRELAFMEKFAVDIAPGENDVFVLAVVLAIDNIHDERRAERQHGIGGGVLGGELGGFGRL